MKRMTYAKALMCLLFPSAALVTYAQHSEVAEDLKYKLQILFQNQIQVPGGCMPN